MSYNFFFYSFEKQGKALFTFEQNIISCYPYLEKILNILFATFHVTNRTINTGDD